MRPHKNGKDIRQWYLHQNVLRRYSAQRLDGQQQQSEVMMTLKHTLATQRIQDKDAVHILPNNLYASRPNRLGTLHRPDT